MLYFFIVQHEGESSFMYIARYSNAICMRSMKV